MKILVTGGAGFIGSHIADGFISQGHEVSVIDNLSMGRRENINPRAKFYLMDIRANELEKIFEHGGFDVVCHHAAQMDVRMSVENPAYDASVNVLGTINILQNCIRFGVNKFLFASTGGAIYGNQREFPCDESHPTNPLSPYGITKLTTEKYLFYYQNEFGLDYVILRYSNVYGPRQNPKGEAGVVAIFTHHILSGNQPIIHGDGNQTRDYVFVGDVVNANLKAIQKEGSEIFNIGTGIETDVNTIFQMINEKTGNRANEKHGPPLKGEQKRSVISSLKAEQYMGWKPNISLMEGLHQTIKYFQEKDQ